MERKVAGSQHAVGPLAGLEVGVELNSREEGLWLTDFKLLVWRVHSITEKISLNW